jgi:hypothetical protein
MFVAFVMPCALGRPACLASPAYAGLTSQLVLARAWAAFIPCGGTVVAAWPLCSCAPYPRRLPPQPPYAGAGAL